MAISYLDHSNRSTGPRPRVPSTLQEGDHAFVCVDYKPLGRKEDLRPALERLRADGDCTVALGLWETDDAAETILEGSMPPDT